MDCAPVISVVMAVYNGAKYLRASLDSILDQSFGDFEFIVIDDGSTDESLSILRSYTDPRLRIITRQNKGLTPSLNEGIAQAQGEFIARMDCDDVALPRRFELQLAMLRSDASLVVVGGEVTRMDAEGRPLTSPRMPLTHDEIEADLLLGKGGALVHPAMMTRAAALRLIGGYREQFRTAQDLDLYLRLSRHGKLANMPEVVLKYRIHDASVSAAKREQQDRDVEKILLDAYASRGQKLPRQVARRRYEATIQQYTRQFWAAWHQRDARLARKNACRVIARAPLRRESWMLLAYAIASSPDRQPDLHARQHCAERRS